jgi:recombination protein RecA
MAALAVPLLELARLGVLQGTSALSGSPSDAPDVLSLDWPELERGLPDRGLPRGVVELAARVSTDKKGAMRGGATTMALSAVRAVHAKDPKAWCAWVTEKSAPSLYAPAALQAGVDLDRLLVVRPEPLALARTVVKVGASGAFDLVVIDAPSGLDGKIGKTRTDGAVVIRKLALASEEKGTTFIVLTNVYAARSTPWPVALRVEVERRPESIALRITKDRRGRASSQHVVRVAC